LEQLQQIAPKTEDFGTGERHRSALSGKQLNSPGILHPHYQPSAEVFIVESLPTELSIDVSTVSAFCGIECGAAVGSFAMVKVFASLEDYAAGFYEFLREVDRQSFTKVFVQAAPNEGIGRALRDRQRRAAGG